MNNTEDEELKAIEAGLDEDTLKAMEKALDELEAEKNRVLTEDEILANYIKDTTLKLRLVPLSATLLNPPEGVSKERAKEVLENLDSSELFKSIKKIDGKRTSYFYDSENMVDRYAEIQVMIQEKDILASIANAARHDCKIYPRPLSISTLTDSPYNYTYDEVLGAVARMKFEKDYEDIDIVKASNGVINIYSKLYMSEKYAQALCEEQEVEWMDEV